MHSQIVHEDALFRVNMRKCALKRTKYQEKWKTHRFPLRMNIFAFLIAELSFGDNFTLEYIYYMPHL